MPQTPSLLLSPSLSLFLFSPYLCNKYTACVFVVVTVFVGQVEVCAFCVFELGSALNCKGFAHAQTNTNTGTHTGTHTQPHIRNTHRHTQSCSHSHTLSHPVEANPRKLLRFARLLGECEPRIELPTARGVAQGSPGSQGGV